MIVFYCHSVGLYILYVHLCRYINIFFLENLDIERQTFRG